MHKKLIYVLSLIIGCCALSTAYGQLFQIKSPKDNAPQGINRVPSPLPVLAPSEFQSQVQSMGEQNRNDMTKNGLDSIQKQLDTLPAVKPENPPTLTSPDKDSDTESPEKSPTNDEASSQDSLKKPTAAEAPPETNYSTSTPAATDSGPSGSETSSPANSPSSGGGLNIQY